MKKLESFQPGNPSGTGLKMGLLGLAIFVMLSGCTLHPMPLRLQERQAEADRLQQVLTEGQEPVTGSIDLYEAMARAVKYNLNYRLKLMEEAISMGQSDMAAFDMLPKLVASAGYTERDNVNASVSESIATGTESLEASSSQERYQRTRDLTLSWNILDFGVSYFQARQQADKYLIFTERRRKALHNLLRDVRFAFWRAAAVQQLETRVRSVLLDAEKALENSYAVEKERLKPILEILTFQKTLLEVTKQLETLQQELALAKVELAHLMNLPPGGSGFELKIPPADEMKILKDEYSLDAMEKMALEQRPELMEIRYQKRISADETKKTLAGLFPGISFSAGYNYNSNRFLTNNSWADAGTQVAWNLMNIFSAPKKMALVKSQEEMLDMQQMTLSMAILSQLHIAYRQYRGFAQQFERNHRLEMVNNKIFEQTKQTHQANTKSWVEKIRAETNAIMAELQRYHSYAQLHNALGRLHASVGLDPLSEDPQGCDVAGLAKALRERIETWDREFLVSAPAPVEVSQETVKAPKGREEKIVKENIVAQQEKKAPVQPIKTEPVEPKIPEPEAYYHPEMPMDRTMEWLMVQDNWSNIRQGPSMKTPIISHGLSGDLYKFTGKKHGVWHQIVLDDGTKGWISDKLVQAVEFDPRLNKFDADARITPVPANGTNIMNGAGWHYHQRGIAHHGMVYTVVQSTSNWVEVRFKDSLKGWAPRREVQQYGNEK